jgi:shikimate kinase
VNSIILIGYRGSGKTTLGKQLAQRLGWPFVDLDVRITEQAGKTIREIFAQHGELKFRELETQHLLETLQLNSHVISLGGGAILAEANRKAIKASGHLVVYLKATPEELHRRILADPATAANRPGLTHLGGSVEEVRTLLTLREPLYSDVKNIELDVSSASVDTLAEQLHQSSTNNEISNNETMTNDE